MNVYDEAHSLAKAIKESNEFIEFEKIKKQVDADEQLSQMLKDLQEKQMQIQAAQMTGEEPSQDLIQQMQSIATMVGTKPLAAQYMQAEATFSVMINDVFGIIGEAIGLNK